jgi:hypothetical protein
MDLGLKSKIVARIRWTMSLPPFSSGFPNVRISPGNNGALQLF